MGISRKWGVAVVAIVASMAAVPALADEATCAGSRCGAVADAEAGIPSPHFVAEIPLPPMRSQTRIVVRRAKAAPSIILASARSFPAPLTNVNVPLRDISRPTSFWLTIGTGF